MSCNPLALMWAGWKVTNTLQVIPEWLKAGFSLRCRHTVINSKARWADVGSWSSTLEKEPKGGLPPRWRASRNVCESNVFLRSSLWIGCAKDGESFPKVSCSPSPFLSPTSRKLNLELRWFSRAFEVENRRGNPTGKTVVALEEGGGITGSLVHYVGGGRTHCPPWMKLFLLSNDRSSSSSVTSLTHFHDCRSRRWRPLL